MLALVRPRLSVGSVLLSALLSAPVQAANPVTPRDELLRFVPADVGFCVVVQNLRDTGKALAESPFIEQFRNSKAGKALQEAKEIAKLIDIEKELQKHFKIGWDDLRNDILGDAVVFAYRPSNKNDEQGLMLIRARNEKALSDLVTRFNEKQKKDGDLTELKELKHKQFVYYARVEKRETTYYHLRGPILVFSGQEKMLQEALDLDLAAPTDAEPTLTKWLNLLGAKKALFAVFINPRAFDHELIAKAESGAAFLKTFLVYWKALDGVALSLTLDREATLAIGVRGRSEDLPAPARKLFTELAKPSDLWRQCPDDALLAIGGRIDLAALMDVFGDFLPAADREKLNTDLSRLLKGTDKDLKQVLPFIGPDLALWLMAPADAKHLFPEGLFALRAAVGDKAAPLLSSLEVWATVAVAISPKPLALKTGTFNKSDVKYLESEQLPLGIRPAFALKHGFLVLAGSPETIGRFSAPAPANSDSSVPLLRISFKAWRGYIEARRDALAEVHAQKEHLKPEEAREHIDSVLSVLEFVDRLEIRHQAGNGHAVVSIVIQTAKPLKK